MTKKFKKMKQFYKKNKLTLQLFFISLLVSSSFFAITQYQSMRRDENNKQQNKIEQGFWDALSRSLHDIRAQPYWAGDKYAVKFEQPVGETVIFKDAVAFEILRSVDWLYSYRLP